MRATWYVLENGTAVDPSECAPDDAGVLTHKSGAKIKMRSFDCPMSTGVDIADATIADQGKPADAEASHSADAQMKPAAKPQAARKPGYKTRKAS